MREIPRRNRVDQMVDAELAIRHAIACVEAMPADERLTAAVMLLDQARNKVSDFVDSQGGLAGMFPVGCGGSE